MIIICKNHFVREEPSVQGSARTQHSTLTHFFVGGGRQGREKFLLTKRVRMEKKEDRGMEIGGGRTEWKWGTGEDWVISQVESQSAST